MIRINKIRLGSAIALVCIWLITMALSSSANKPALAAKPPRTPTPTATATRTPTPIPTATHTLTPTAIVTLTPTPSALGTWVLTSSMTSPRFGNTATRLADGRVLVVGGEASFSGSLGLPSAEIYDPGTGGWAQTGSMNTGRTNHSATLLGDGRVLVAGGDDGAAYSPTYFASAEIYDPATRLWSPTGIMSVARSAHPATALTDGRVLVVGGLSIGGSNTAGEIYDPGTGLWSLTGTMNFPDSTTLTLLVDGRVLAISRGTGAEIFDPATNSLSLTGNMATNRSGFQEATRLADGRVLVAGGIASTGQVVANAEIYNPATGTWSPTGSLTTPRYYFTMTLLNDGRVLAVSDGRSSGPGFGIAEIYNPATGAWSVTSSLNQFRSFHAAALLNDGRVLIAGGAGCCANTLDSAEIFTP